MNEQIKKFTFRLEAATLEKIRYIADNDFRTINKELELIVKKHITEYEKQHGLILLNKDEIEMGFKN